MAFSPDGKTLAVGANDGTVWLWNLADPAHPALTATLSGLPGHVFSVAFSPYGQQLAAASNDDTVRLWDTSPAAARADVCANSGSSSPGRSGRATSPACPTAHRADQGVRGVRPCPGNAVRPVRRPGMPYI